MDIDELPLSVRAEGVLKKAGIDTVEDLCRFTAEQLLRVGNFGKKSLAELEEVLKERSFVSPWRAGRSASSGFIYQGFTVGIQRFEPEPRKLGQVYDSRVGPD